MQGRIRLPGGIRSNNGEEREALYVNWLNTEQDVNLLTQYSLQWLSEGQVRLVFTVWLSGSVFFFLNLKL